MNRSNSLYKINEVHVQTKEKAPPEEEHVVRWRGRRIVLRKGSPFPWWKDSNEPTEEELRDQQQAKSPVALLLKMLRSQQN